MWFTGRSRQLIVSQEAERKRIAVGLHDSLGQQLLVIKNWAMIELSAAQKDNSAREGLNEISTTASQAIEEVREIIYDLRPYQLDKIGLASTIQFMIEKVAAASSIEFEVEIGEIDNLFSGDAEITRELPIAFRFNTRHYRRPSDSPQRRQRIDSGCSMCGYQRRQRCNCSKH